MFDTMTMTKIVGGFCGALLVFLLANWAGESLFSMEPANETQAFLISADEGGGAETQATEQNFDELYAAADVAHGEKIFAKCKACHKIDGQNATGPHLNGVVGRPVASVPDFQYDEALKSLGGDWTPDRIQQFVESPKKYAPGTKMGFAGLPKMQDRADVIAYLATLSG